MRHALASTVGLDLEVRGMDNDRWRDVCLKGTAILPHFHVRTIALCSIPSHDNI